MDEDGKTVIGGISLFDTDDYEEAKKFAFNDPYQKANIRRETKILKCERSLRTRGLTNARGVTPGSQRALTRLLLLT